MIQSEVELAEGESLVSDPDELIYRQITRHMVTDDGQVGSTAFMPSTSDQGKPSFTRSSIVSAQDARDWHTRNARSRSLGVRAISITEVAEAGRVAIDDSRTPLEDGASHAPGHCFVDFRGLDKPGRKGAASVLLRFALQRGEIPTTETLEDGEMFALDSAT